MAAAGVPTVPPRLTRSGEQPFGTEMRPEPEQLWGIIKKQETCQVQVFFLEDRFRPINHHCL